MKFLVVSTPKFIMNVFCTVMMMILHGSIYPAYCDNKEADVYNVVDYGATSLDGRKDSSQAFLKAWNAACNAETGAPKVLVPKNGTFLVSPLIFQGPCRTENISFMLSGTIVAPNSPSFWTGLDPSKWLVFNGINGLTVDGYGEIDGQGKGWWDQSCKLNPELKNCTRMAPTALRFYGCNESTVSNIHLTNSPRVHIYVGKSHGFRVENLKIKSPEKSPNTDGIHVQASRSLSIKNSIIATGDDCISVGDYSSDIKIANITCGPGHGISIGSLGREGNFVQVSDIHVSDSIFDGTTNGARIKTWQVGKGYARDITFRNLQFINVKNPIIIDQNYCDIQSTACEERDTGVKISNVTYVTMSGTSSSDIAINLNCSRSAPCTGIFMQSIRFASSSAGKGVGASCNNASGRERDIVPGPCLTHSTFTSPMRN